MKAPFESLNDANTRSFYFNKVTPPYLDAPYHFHAEYELSFIVNGEGKRFVGQDIAHFTTGDVVLLGSNLSHCWQSLSPAVEAIVVQFGADFMGENFLKRPELAQIARLLEKSTVGLAFTGSLRTRAGRELQMMSKLTPFQQLLSLLDLLNTLSQTNEVRLIDKNAWPTNLNESDRERVSKIYAYLIANFRQEIHLDQAAECIEMSPTAFCRYFKRITKQTFFDVVTDYRVRYASQLLLSQPEMPVTEICFESGFGNISHFNKQFKLVTDFTPLHYRKAHLHK